MALNLQRSLNEAVEELDGVRTIADDIIIFGVGDRGDEAVADHDRKLLALMERCRQRDIKLNKAKISHKISHYPSCHILAMLFRKLG